MIRYNWEYKLLSLVVAVTLWAYVQAERNPQGQKTFTVNLVAINRAKGYTVDLHTQQVSVIVRGAKSVLERISPQNVSAVVDMAGFKAGRDISVPVKPAISGLSDDDKSAIEAPSALPGTIRVAIEATTEKRLPVEVKFLTAPPLGYAYGSPELDPASVRISGKASEVVRVRRVVLPLTGQLPNGPVDDVFDLTPVDSTGSVVSAVKLDPPSVQLRLQLVEVPATKTVLVSPSLVGSPKYPASVTKVTVTPPTVVLEGKPAVLSGISTVPTEKLSIEDADGAVTRDVALQLPANVRVVGHGRARVSVDIGTP